MIFFEVVLYYNYKAIGVLQTKCDIEKRLKLTRNNENINVASALLSSVYKVRNDMAHSNLATSKDVKNLLEIISSIDSLDQMKAIVDLLIPGDHPDCLANIYYLVERDSENPEYVKLKDSILKELCELRQDNKHTTIGEVRQKYAKSYEQDVVCYAILDVLKSFHIVR